MRKITPKATFSEVIRVFWPTFKINGPFTSSPALPPPVIGPVVPLADGDGDGEGEAREGETEEGDEAKTIGSASRSKGGMSTEAMSALVG